MIFFFNRCLQIFLPFCLILTPWAEHTAPSLYKKVASFLVIKILLQVFKSQGQAKLKTDFTSVTGVSLHPS